MIENFQRPSEFFSASLPSYKKQQKIWNFLLYLLELWPIEISQVGGIGMKFVMKAPPHEVH